MSRIHKIDGIILTLEIADMVVRFEELRLRFPVGLARHQPGLLVHMTQPAQHCGHATLRVRPPKVSFTQ